MNGYLRTNKKVVSIIVHTEFYGREMYYRIIVYTLRVYFRSALL